MSITIDRSDIKIVVKNINSSKYLQQYPTSYSTLYLNPKTAMGRFFPLLMYSKTCLKRPLEKRQKLSFKTDYLLMQVESIVECSKRAFYNTFDLQ